MNSLEREMERLGMTADECRTAYSNQWCNPMIDFGQQDDVSMPRHGEWGIWIEFLQGQHHPTGPLTIISMTKQEALKFAIDMLQKLTAK